MHHTWARLAFLGLATVTGTNYLAMKVLVKEMPSGAIIFWRFLFAASFLLLLPSVRSGARSATLWRAALPIGLVLGAALVLLAIAIRLAGSGETAFWVSSDVAFVPILGFLFFGERPRKKTLVGIVLALFGLALLSLESSSLTLRAGSLMGIFSALAFAVWIIALARISKQFGAAELGFAQVVPALGLTTAWAIFVNEISIPKTPLAWALCFYLGVLGTGMRFSVQAYLQRFVSTSETALLYLWEPVVAALFGYFFLGEMLGGSQVLGCGLILFGIAYSQVRMSTSASS